MGSRSLNEVLAAIQRPSRTARLHVIQEQIKSLRPDAWEAGEIVDSLKAALRLGYEDRAEEAQTYAKAFSEALQRLDTGWEVLP